MKYAGSVDYDNDQGEWVDTLVERDTKIEFIIEMKRLLRTRRNSSVFLLWKLIMVRKEILQKRSELNANNQTPQKKVPEFRMGSEKKHSQSQSKTSLKTKLIRAAGSYGNFEKKYKVCSFTTTNNQAKKLIPRNQKCFCNSQKKFKRCCMID